MDNMSGGGQNKIDPDKIQTARALSRAQRGEVQREEAKRTADASFRLAAAEVRFEAARALAAARWTELNAQDLRREAANLAAFADFLSPP